MSSRWSDKLIVGLTGNIATGKSAVLEFAARQGALTLDADQLVHQILEDDEEAQRAIGALMGPEVQLPDGGIDRQAVAQIVFMDSDALRDLEQIIHPRVRRRIFEKIDNGEQSIVFIEAIKLLEGDLAAECDEIWVTRCPLETQIQRLVTIRGMDEESAVMRVGAQSSQEKKVAMADVVIDTSGSMDDTYTQVALAWNGLIRNLPSTGSETELTRSPEGKIVADEVKADDRSGVTHSSRKLEPEVSKEDPNAGYLDGVIVRRARPTDIPALLLLIHQATAGTVKKTRGELLLSLGDRGYLIGQEGTEISAVVGWTAENQVASIDQIFIYPAEKARRTGAAILREIENTANELLCEVILVFPDKNEAEDIQQLFQANGFEYVDPKSLPAGWQEIVSGTRSENSGVMLKQLGANRNLYIRKIRQN